MDIQGKIIDILDKVKGQSSNGDWSKQSFILETVGQYPRKVCFDLWNDKIETASINMGDMLTASIELSSREYNGKWYTDVKAWKIDKSHSGILSQPVKLDGMPLGHVVRSENDEEELPF